MPARIEYVVTGQAKMHCSSCERIVGAALQKIAGVQHAWASALSQRIVVTFDPEEVEPQQLEAKLEQLGYEVALRKRAEKAPAV